MAVFVVLISINFKLLDLSTTLYADIVLLRFLLGGNSRQAQMAKLHLRFQAKKALRPPDEVATQGQADVARLDFLQDGIFATGKVVAIIV